MKVDVDIFRKLVDKLKKLGDKFKKLVDKSIKLVDKQSKVLDKSQNCSSLKICVAIIALQKNKSGSSESAQLERKPTTRYSDEPFIVEAK
ncbi:MULTISPECIES: hypothetical protein [unclassified Lysinibacillus]|uniref:hypothetical protein n=1 Tax=unclassified Lysinibacillus TaxID=2636778 RepID=UPI002553609A|nr:MULTISPECIES: hypothetical protein [unclassified Lysinibacillus]MDM5246368.1 hypothetical protein [Lysinibacillus sp. G4S2]